MNCANHMDLPATAYCRTCGKAMCANCARDVRGVIYCEECLAARVSDPAVAAAGTTPPATPHAEGSASPGLAALLGFIPGVGAMYNGQFAKGFVHVLVFASLIWLSNHDFEVLGGLGIMAWIFYMVFDAYMTAKARKHGMPLPDPLGLNNIFGVDAGAANRVAVATEPTATHAEAVDDKYVEPQTSSAVPIGAVVLIGLGVLFLLDNLNLMHFGRIARLWPLILIVIGVQMFLRRRAMARR